MSKFCKFCEIEHPETAEFWYMGRGKVSRCKIQKKAYNAANAEVIAEQRKEYRKANAEAIRKKVAKYREENGAFLRERERNYRKENFDTIKATQQSYREAHPEVARARAKHRRQNDQQYRLSSNLRTRLGEAIRHKSKKGSAVRDLGCSIEFLESYLQARFTSEMSWDNYGTAWHIDHIYPLARVDLEDRAQFIKACNYRNLQPMLAAENFAKGSSVAPETVEWFMGLEV